MSLKKIEFIYKVKSFCDTKMHNEDDNASDHGSEAGSEAMFSVYIKFSRLTLNGDLTKSKIHSPTSTLQIQPLWAFSLQLHG